MAGVILLVTQKMMTEKKNRIEKLIRSLLRLETKIKAF